MDSDSVVSDVVVTCESCGKGALVVGTGAAYPASSVELRERIVERLGPDGMFVCPQCRSLVFAYVEDAPIAGAERLRRIEQAQRIGLSAKGVRVGVGVPDGRRSSVWRVWMNHRRDDVYIAARGLASRIKASLHPGFWYYGFTSDYALRRPSVVPDGGDRKLRVMSQPDEFGPGWTRAFTIVIPASELAEARGAYSGSEAIWLPAPMDGLATYITVLLSAPDAACGCRGYPYARGHAQSTELLTRLEMSTGQVLWVVAHVGPLVLGAAARLADVRAKVEAAADQNMVPTGYRSVMFGESSTGGYFLDVAPAF